MAAVSCPFCNNLFDDEYETQLHIEQHHTDDSPFALSNTTPVPTRTSSEQNGVSDELAAPNRWTKCTRAHCGEWIMLSDVDDHLELHDITAAIEAEEEPDLPNPQNSQTGRRSPPRNRQTRDASQPQSPRKSRQSEVNGNRANYSILNYFAGTSYHGSRHAPPPRAKIKRVEPHHEQGRLGRRELGPHAFEKVMPAETRRHLLNDALPYTTQRIGRDGRLYKETAVENETTGLIPTLADLCTLDSSTKVAYFCDPSVRHVVKLRCDGNFCGYWNIQMLLSFLQPDHDSHDGKPGFLAVPNVLQIQDTIEQAWDSGVCSYGRIETGGVRGTRKWIGTHEAVAYFTQIGVKVEALTFTESKEDSDKDDSEDDSSKAAVMALLDHIEAYFISGLETARRHHNSHTTRLAPIYFQRFGHSMTIVGLERKNDGSRNLLVFDPSWATTDGMRRLLAGRRLSSAPETLLRAYRRSDVGLSRWEEFEVVTPQVDIAGNGSR